MPKNVQTTTQLHSFHMLAKSCSKSFKLSFNSTLTENFQIYKLDLEKTEKPEIKHLSDHRKSKGIPENIYFCWLHWSLWLWITKNCRKFLKKWEDQTTIPASWETCMQVKKQQLEPDMEQCTGSKLRKEHIKAVYHHPAHLTHMQSTSWEIPG